jgi:hypothetical protein
MAACKPWNVILPTGGLNQDGLNVIAFADTVFPLPLAMPLPPSPAPPLPLSPPLPMMLALPVPPLPLLPPPPTAPVAPPSVFGSTAHKVSATASLSGYTSATFDASAQGSFVSAMSGLLLIAPSAVTIDGVSDVPGRRRLAAGSVAVDFSVTTSSSTAAAGLASSITAVSPASFVSALQSSGLTACTGVAVSAPVLTAPPPLVVNVSSITNIEAATEAVAAQFANLDAADAVAQQGAFLTSLVDGGAANLSSAAAENTASLVLAVLTAAPSGAVLSLESQSAALDVLASVAAAPINVTGGAAQSVTAALSAVALAAGESSNPAALTLVQNVLTSLASSQATSLAAALDALPPGAPPPAPATTSSATIQTLVQVDPPGGSRLTTMSLTAPGSPSSFSPMPAELFANTTTAVVTQFFSLKFDPNGANSTLNTTGVTRLAFSAPDGSPIPVEDAAKPILFTLPHVDTSGDAQAVCSFWDATAGAYATHGCTSVPSPQPPGHTLMFIDGYETPDDASLALAWSISGPMVDGGLCSVKVLDCNQPSPGVIYPDPRNPLLAPAVACPPRLNASNTTEGNTTTAERQPVLRVFYGTNCPLWKSSNAYGCSWDNVKQSFVGDRCVSVGNTTRCMCRHLSASVARACMHARLLAKRLRACLHACAHMHASHVASRPRSPADFASARTPKIATCSLSDLTSLNPADLVTKLKVC